MSSKVLLQKSPNETRSLQNVSHEQCHNAKCPTGENPKKIGIFHVMAHVDDKHALIFVQNCSVRSKQAIISQTPWSEINQF